MQLHSNPAPRLPNRAAPSKQSSRGVILVELAILIAVVAILITVLLSYFTTTRTVVSLSGGWANTQFTAVGPTPFPVKYAVGLKETTTVTPPFGSPSVTRAAIPLQAGIASVKFSLVGANGAVFITGGREYTMVIGPNGTADIKILAVANGTDMLMATVNYNGGAYPDTQIVQFETHKP
jgi:hypothetical protein